MEIMYLAKFTTIRKRQSQDSNLDASDSEVYIFSVVLYCLLYIDPNFNPILVTFLNYWIFPCYYGVTIGIVIIFSIENDDI